MGRAVHCRSSSQACLIISGAFQPAYVSGDLLKNQMQQEWDGPQISEVFKGQKGDSVHLQVLETHFVMNEFENQFC